MNQVWFEGAGEAAGEAPSPLPFVIGVLADLGASAAQPLRERSFVEIDRDNFDDVLRAIRPQLLLEVDDAVTGGDALLKLELTFENLDDFSPPGLVRKIPALRELLKRRAEVERMRSAPPATAALADEALREMADQLESAQPSDSPLLDQILDNQEQAAGPRPSSRRPPSRADSILADLDRRFAAQITSILHHRDFQRLEGAWRGLHYLVMNAQTGSALKIRVLSASRGEIQKDIEEARDLSDSALFAKLIDPEFLSPQWLPFGCVVAAYSFSNAPEELDLLAVLATAAAQADCPLIADASPAFLGLDSWNELAERSVHTLMESPVMVKWRSLREMDETRCLVMALPRVLARRCYGKEGLTLDEFACEEPVGPGNAGRCWMNCSWVLAARVADAFDRTGWPLAICGIETGGIVENLKATRPMTDSGRLCATEALIESDRAAQLAQAGFLPLSYESRLDEPLFAADATVHKPRRYDSAAATASAQLSAHLISVLLTSRITHLLKSMLRDHALRFGGRKAPDLASYANRQLAQMLSGESAPALAGRTLVTEAQVDFQTAKALAMLHLRLASPTGEKTAPAPLRIGVPIPSAGP